MSKEVIPGLDTTPTADISVAYERGDIVLAKHILDVMVTDIREKDPEIGCYAFYKEIAGRVPYFVPERFQKQLISESHSRYPERKKIAGEVFVFVNSKTVLSAISKFITTQREGNDEIVQVAVVKALEVFPNLSRFAQTTLHLHRAIYQEVQTYMSKETSIPFSIIIDPEFDRIRKEVKTAFHDFPGGMSIKNANLLVERLNRKYHISKNVLKFYISIQNFTREPATELEEHDLIDQAMKNMLPEKFLKVLDKIGLTERQKLVLFYRHGLIEDFEEHTLEEVGQHVAGFTPQRVMQILAKVGKKLRMAPEAKELKEYL